MSDTSEMFIGFKSSPVTCYAPGMEPFSPPVLGKYFNSDDPPETIDFEIDLTSLGIPKGSVFTTLKLNSSSSNPDSHFDEELYWGRLSEFITLIILSYGSKYISSRTTKQYIDDNMKVIKHKIEAFRDQINKSSILRKKELCCKDIYNMLVKYNREECEKREFMCFVMIELYKGIINHEYNINYDFITENTVSDLEAIVCDRELNDDLIYDVSKIMKAQRTKS